jgi:N-methylhydantoinase A
MAEIVAELFPEAQVSISSDIVREWREFERTSTTVLNVYTKPQMAAYLSALDRGLQVRGYRGSFNIMQSSGGMTSSTMAQHAPIRTMQSGPAGGVIGAAALGARLNLPNLVSADVGGTTFDVALIVDGRSLEKSSAPVNRRPVLQPTLDIVSIGAGGGSIAWLDREGGLRVGPHSAQAVPGPACFGLGGQEPTITDAQVVLGYLDPDFYLGRRMRLDQAAAERAINDKIAQPLGLSLRAAAQGMVHLTQMNMVYAIRNITIERGHDPRDFGLVCFGGGGGMFAGALLQELELSQAIIPANPATFSAWGLLNANFREDLSRTLVMPLAELSPAGLSERLATMEGEARAKSAAHQIDPETLVIECFADLRYQGQEHSVTIPIQPDDLSGSSLAGLRARFDAYHEKAYAHALPEYAVEFVHLRLSALGLTLKPGIPKLPLPDHATAEAQKGRRPAYFAGFEASFDCPVYDRDRLGPGHHLAGPAIVEEWSSTSLVPPGQQLTVDPYGNLILRVRP